MNWVLQFDPTAVSGSAPPEVGYFNPKLKKYSVDSNTDFKGDRQLKLELRTTDISIRSLCAHSNTLLTVTLRSVGGENMLFF